MNILDRSGEANAIGFVATAFVLLAIFGALVDDAEEYADSGQLSAA